MMVMMVTTMIMMMISAILPSIYIKFRVSTSSIRRRQSRAQVQAATRSPSSRRRLRTNILLALLSLVFLLSWAPINILTLLIKFNGLQLVHSSQFNTTSDRLQCSGRVPAPGDHVRDVPHLGPLLLLHLPRSLRLPQQELPGAGAELQEEPGLGPVTMKVKAEGQLIRGRRYRNHQNGCYLRLEG